MIEPARPRWSKAAGISGASALPIPASGQPAPHVAARLVPLDPGLYAFSLAAETGWREQLAGLALPAVHICAPPRQDRTILITDSFGRAGSWLGGRHKVLFVKSPPGGGAALVTGYLTRASAGLPLALDIRRLSPPGPPMLAAEGAEREPRGRASTPLAPVMTLRMGDTVAAERSPPRIGLDVIAHIRGRGDVRFPDTPWVGRLGPGLWIEGFVILPRTQSVAAAIEYKGLNASGAETPWIAGGTLCGNRGGGIPLIGFAVRQKAVPGGVALDCEYTGYFQSGAMVGPARNGAPCRSTIDRDALEGIQLRITPRPPRPASTRSGWVVRS
jgi:hypothetical protein